MGRKWKCNGPAAQQDDGEASGQLQDDERPREDGGTLEPPRVVGGITERPRDDGEDTGRRRDDGEGSKCDDVPHGGAGAEGVDHVS